MKEKLLLVVGG